MKKIQDDFDKWAKKMLSKERTVGAFLNREIYPMLFVGSESAQFERWRTENTSQGPRWAANNPEYAERKLTRFAKFPGAGRRLLVATSRLLNANTGRPSVAGDLRKIVQGNRLTVAIRVPYARYVDAERSFLNFNRLTYIRIERRLRRYFGDAA